MLDLIKKHPWISVAVVCTLLVMATVAWKYPWGVA